MAAVQGHEEAREALAAKDGGEAERAGKAVASIAGRSGRACRRWCGICVRSIRPGLARGDSVRRGRGDRINGRAFYFGVVLTKDGGCEIPLTP